MLYLITHLHQKVIQKSVKLLLEHGANVNVDGGSDFT